MRKILMMLLFAWSVTSAGAAPITGSHTFSIGDDAFLLDAKPFVIRCGEMHFARIPRALWRHRLQMVRAAGFNAVCAYMFWNYHEPVRGRYDFAGEQDVAAFCRLAQEEGLWVVLRPGPYTCAEWEFGGLPWWLLKEDGIRLRTADPRYLEPACAYLAEVGRQLADNQITRGGNILMVQVENEYGFWGNDKDYMRRQYHALREAGFEVPAFCCNPAYNLRNGLIDELLPVVNFGSNPKEAFAKLREVRATGPLMCGEYYPAWFDSWGERHHVKPARQCLEDLEYMLQNRASFSVYMAHGGTSFAWWAGCNAPFRPQTSSYDYDAPVTEAGWRHPTKFAALRELFGKYLNEGETMPEVPEPMPVQKAEVTAKPRIVSLPFLKDSEQELLPALESEHPLTFEKAGMGYGVAVYSTTIPAGRGGELKADVRDLGVVLIDDLLVGYFDRRFPKATLKIAPADQPRQLEILVEPMGRYNFGQIMHESKKGLVGDVTLDGQALLNWKMIKVDLNENGLKGLVFSASDLDVGASDRLPPGTFLKYSVKLAAKDTFLDLRDWKRGMVCVNGHWIGRYWSIGPTQTLYIPGCWLREGDNEIIIWDAVGASPKTNTLHFLDQPILGEMRPETDYFSFQPRPKLAQPLAGSTAVHAGTFANGLQRQDVRFTEPVKGRYFALETLNSWDGKDVAACSEIDLVDGAGRNIPHTKWTIAACDSEERAAEDGSAENLVDGQTANMWHTEWKRSRPKHPHYFVIDLGQEETVGGFNFTPRQSNGPGRIKDYRVYVLPSVAVTEVIGQ